MSRTEALSQYRIALKAGQKCYRDCVHEKKYPYLVVLDELLGDSVTAGRVDMGIIDIPADRIAGTCYVGRRNAFAANFMPLLSPESEFALKWVNLCESAMEIGVREPISCFEFMGRFYVQEGNKRVSVQKSLGAAAISAKVTRILPAETDDEAVKIYHEFVQFHRCSGLYWIYFDRPGCFARLQAALGYSPDYEWSEDDRLTFTSALHGFRRALERLNKQPSTEELSLALLIWLQVYSLQELLTLEESVLDKSILNIWPEVQTQLQPESIAVSTAPQEPSVSLLGRFLLPNHLRIGIIHEGKYNEGDWITAHEEGLAYMESCLSREVECRTYRVPPDGDPEAVMLEAIADGATVLFTTTVNLITACRKIAAEHRNIRILNCSVSMPYPGVRTYNSRIYEAKFVSGAIAGVMSRSDLIGYIAHSPIYGAPASINAFALGAKMTRPNARILLKWKSVSKDPVEDLLYAGVDIISSIDTTTRELLHPLRGLVQLKPDGSLESLASPYRNWGNFYIQMVNSILRGGWEDPQAENCKAINYWWGMNSGVVDIRLSPDLPEGVQQLARILRRGIGDGSVSPFHRTLYDQQGNLQSDGHRWFSPDELLHMDWLCDNVEGSIPTYDQLIPQARQIVRLQGVYRESIPLEKDEFIP